MALAAVVEMRAKGLEPPRLAPPEPKSGVSTISPRPRVQRPSSQRDHERACLPKTHRHHKAFWCAITRGLPPIRRSSPRIGPHRAVFEELPDFRIASDTIRYRH